MQSRFAWCFLLNLAFFHFIYLALFKKIKGRKELPNTSIVLSNLFGMNMSAQLTISFQN